MNRGYYNSHDVSLLVGNYDNYLKGCDSYVFRNGDIELEIP